MKKFLNNPLYLIFILSISNIFLFSHIKKQTNMREERRSEKIAKIIRDCNLVKDISKVNPICGHLLNQEPSSKVKPKNDDSVSPEVRELMLWYLLLK